MCVFSTNIEQLKNHHIGGKGNNSRIDKID